MRPMNNEINTDFNAKERIAGVEINSGKNSFNGLLPWPTSFSLLCSRDRRSNPVHTGSKGNTFYELNYNKTNFGGEYA